ncbi:MAG: radical SAM protein [Ardenticatenales bacterium]|nr:radical SAM protein [Ardenticatenales bacterium]
MPADLADRLAVLADGAQYDLCAQSGRPMPDGASSSSAAPSDAGSSDGRIASATAGTRPERRYRHGDVTRHIQRISGPRGPTTQLRVLQTNACAKDCFYCPFRAGRNFRREAFTPDELARLTDGLHRAGRIQALFLSSGVVGHDDHSMAQIVATGEILRRRYRYSGYLHLKMMPGASDAAIEAALTVADRVSVNLEAPTAAHLARLTSTKDLAADLLAPLRRVKRIVDARRLRRRNVVTGRDEPVRVSRTTQFVVGPAGESDRDLLGVTQRLYRELGLSCVYYSAFRPVPDTPLDGHAPEDPRRERRLYQADFLLRDYGWSADELPMTGERLDLDADPKLAWARAHPDHFPVEVNRAGRDALLRVPGIGPIAADRVIAARREGRLRSPDQLGRLGVDARALDLVTVDGRRAAAQLSLGI